MAISDEHDTVSTAIADTVTGYFLLKGIYTGEYEVVIEPSDNTCQKQTIEDVSVTLGVITDLGTIELEQEETEN